MIDVTAAIAPAAPNLRSQIAAARSIGSNGRPSGLRTATTYRRGPGSPRAPARPPANPMARVARREPAPARPCPCRCRFVPHHGDNLHRYTRAPPVTSWTRMFTASYIPLLGENVTEARSGAYMQSGHAATAYAPVLAAGVGVRHGSGWALRSVTFRLDRSDLGSAALGIVSRRPAASASLIDVLTGLAQLDYGSLRVLGQDMSTARGRSIARPQVGIARRIGRLQPASRIRGLVEHAARLAPPPPHGRPVVGAGGLGSAGSSLPAGSAAWSSMRPGWLASPARTGSCWSRRSWTGWPWRRGPMCRCERRRIWSSQEPGSRPRPCISPACC